MSVSILQMIVMLGIWVLLDVIFYSNSKEIFNRNMTCNVHVMIFVAACCTLAVINKWIGE